MKLLVILFATICFVSCREIKYTDCGLKKRFLIYILKYCSFVGNGEVKSVDVVPCSSDPCEFTKGEKVQMTAVIIANQNSNHANISVTVEVEGIPIKFPGIDPDGCKSVKCPLVEGQKYTFKTEIDVQSWMPAVSDMSTKMTWKVAGDQKQLVCAYTTVVL
ncbi:group 2 allergen Ale o 2-like protein, partial [Leptotrombidium deliense]